jgi:hypothetical protein
MTVHGMPFGSCSTPATFERLIETILRGLNYESYLVYLDDVIVIGRTFQEHLLNLRKIDRKVCDDGTLVQILCFWTLSIVISLSKTRSCLFFKTRFGDCILSPSSGKTYSVGPNR